MAAAISCAAASLLAWAVEWFIRHTVAAAGAALGASGGHLHQAYFCAYIKGTSNCCCTTAVPFNHWHTRQFAAYALLEAHVNARRGIPDKKCPGSPKSLCILPRCARRMADAGPLPKLSGRCVQRADLLQSCACPFFNGTMLWRVDLRRARGFGLRWFVRGFFKGGRRPPPPEQGQQGDEARSFCKLSRSDCADAPPKGHA